MKSKCEYFKGVTQDDKKGNCSACGAPRKEDEEFSIPVSYTYGTPVKTSHLYGIHSSTNAFSIFSTTA